MPRILPTKLTFTSNDTQVAVSFPCVFYGFLLGMDGSNDPTITVYDAGTTDVTGKTEIVPTNTYDASALNLNGVMIVVPLTCIHGVTVDVTLDTGQCEITVYHG